MRTPRKYYFVIAVFIVLCYFAFLRGSIDKNNTNQRIIDKVRFLENQANQEAHQNSEITYKVLKALRSHVAALDEESENENIPGPQIEEQPIKFAIKQPPKLITSDNQPVIPVLVFACNRVTINKCLDNLIEFRPSSEQFPIIVSQDCRHKETKNVILSYQDQVELIEQPDQSEIPLPPKEKFLGYYKIARHYGWALNHTFQKGYEFVIIVEDDLNIAPDFFEYFRGTYPLLRNDSSLW